MGSIKYNKAFETELTHDYYVYGGAPTNNEFAVNRNMAIVPTKECEELMKRGRMRFVRTPKGFTTFFQSYVDGNNVELPFVKLQDGAEFVFALYLDVSAIGLLLNVSDLNVGSKSYGAGKFFMLNQTVDGATPAPPDTLTFVPTLANSLRAPIFGYTFKPIPSWSGLADIVVRYGGPGGPIVQTITGIQFNTVNGTFSAEIDLSKEKKGFYVLKAYKTTTLIEIDSNDFYVDGDLASQNVFGIMRMKYDDIDKLYTTIGAPEDLYTFEYGFGVRSTRWRYYVVAENLEANFFTGNSLKILDESGGAIAFYASEPPPEFSQVLGKPDPNIAISGLRTVIFDSQADIPFSEKAMRDINLYEMPANKKLISNLPNPNSQGTDSDQYNPAQVPPLAPDSDISEIYVYV